MQWYDLFAMTYDLQLERLYAPWRAELFAQLQVPPDGRVLDLGCGTGQNFPGLWALVPEGDVVGVDLSPGMLAKARARAAKAGREVTLLEADLMGLDGLDLGTFDLVVETVVFTAVPDPVAVTRAAFAKLRPGGTFAMLDVHAPRRTVHTTLVEWIARADLNRTVWTELEAMGEGFERRVLPAPERTFGGELFVAMAKAPIT